MGAKIRVGSDISENKNSILETIDEAVRQRADILITPEGSLSGYTNEFEQIEVEPALAEIVAAASRGSVGLALGTCYYESAGACFNQIRFYDSNGGFLGFHSKILRCGTLTDPPIGEINYFEKTPLRTFEFRGIRIGGLICNDLWANPQCTPEPDTHLTHQLSLLGARIIFHSVNGGRDGGVWSEVGWEYHESNLKMRAHAGGLWIVTVDNSDPEHLRSSAPSGVIDPAGEWRARAADTGADTFVYELELE